MGRFRKILAIYDLRIGSEEVLLRAQSLAKANSADLTIAEVVERLPRDAAQQVRPAVGTDYRVRTALVEECGLRLERVAESLRGSGFHVHTEVLSGKAAAEIIRLVIQDGYDLVILIDDAGRSWKLTELGNRGTQLLRKCPCPVWLLRPRRNAEYKRIIAAVDPDHDGGVDELDLRIVQTACLLAQSHGAHLDVVNAWQLSADDAMTSSSEVSSEFREELVRKNRAPHEVAVTRILEAADLGAVPCAVHLLQGEPVTAISSFAEETSADLIVMGTECRMGLNRWLMGSTAEDVVARADCSVLAVKPRAFVSPFEREHETSSRAVRSAR